MGSKLLNYRRNLSSVFSSLSSFSPFSFLQILCWISVLIKLIIKKGGKRRNFILGNFFSKKKKTRKNPNFTSLTLSMEFWGAEVKSGQNFEIELEDDGSRILHLSQVALGEGTGDNKKVKAKETICLYLKFKNEKFLVGTLSQEKCPQIALDLVLHDKFELSHTRKNGSVYVTGYYVGTSQGSDTESEEDLLEPTMNLVQSVPAASDPTTTEQVTIVSSDKDEESSEEQEPRLLVNGENDSDDADSDEDDSDDADCDYHPDIDDADGNEDDGEEDSSDEDKKTPEKVMIYTKQVTIVSSDEDEESSEEQEPRMLVNGENDSDDADSDEDDSDDADCDYHPDIDDADGNEDDGEEDSSDEDKKTPEKVMIYTKQVTIVSSDEDEESSEEQEPRMLVNGENDSDDADSDEDDGEEDSSDEDQKTPEKAGPSRKRPAMSSMKTPAAPKKKAKLVTPQKTGRFSLPSLPFSFWCR
ncbi:histone deacetylase HDT3-like isoform X7 [Gossypium raimondii]|uniref:histone deacetylase HDT3-like isoform X7 n=1 Tax=Gossypium raimondii TaxID=29730 RepID=UPI00227C4387|nr:histone deacetylase HDT3-like isoform X7 [Gossypium raimondii]